MFHLGTTLYPTKKTTWCLYTSFVNNAEQIKSKCYYEVKPQLQCCMQSKEKSVIDSDIVYRKGSNQILTEDVLHQY